MKTYCVCGNFSPHVVDYKKGVCLDCGHRLKMSKDWMTAKARKFWSERYPERLSMPSDAALSCLADFGMQIHESKDG